MHYEINYFRVSLLVTAILMVAYLAALNSDNVRSSSSHRESRSSGSRSPSSGDSRSSFHRVRRSEPAATTDPSAKPQVQRPFQMGSAQIPACPVVLDTVEFNRRNVHWLPLDSTFYAKVVGDPSRMGGGWFTTPGDIPVIASTRVSDVAVQEAFMVVNRKILLNLRRDLLKELHDARTRVVILADDEEVAGLPEARPDMYFLRGIVTTTEANVLCSAEDRRRGESILIGQLGNEILRALEKDASFAKRLSNLWSSARQRRIYSDNDQITSPRSYWVESVKNYFGANLDSFRIHDRKLLHAQDPEMETMLSTIFRNEGYQYVCPALDHNGNLLGCIPPPQQRRQREADRSVIKRPAEPAPAPPPHLNIDTFASLQDQVQLLPAASAEQTQKLSKLTEAGPGSELSRRMEVSGPRASEPHCHHKEIHCVQHDGRIYLQCAPDGHFRSQRAPPGTLCKEVDGVVEFVSLASTRSVSPKPEPLVQQEL